MHIEGHLLSYMKTSTPKPSPLAFEKSLLGLGLKRDRVLRIRGINHLWYLELRVQAFRGIGLMFVGWVIRFRFYGSSSV